MVFLHDEATHVVMRVRSGGGWLVLADAPFSGWRATVDGVGRSWQRANFCMRTLPIEPGEHVVAFRYRPPLLWAGVAQSGIALGMWIVLLLRRPAHASGAAR